MIEKITWNEFKDSGMLWFVNRMLHIFGLAIIFEYSVSPIEYNIDETIKNVSKEVLVNIYPARVKFRGFETEVESANFIKVTEFMNKYSEELLKEAKE
jgi:hypothetical protein